MEKITQRLIFSELFEKPIHYQFDEPHSSSGYWCSLGNGELPLNYRTEERFYERDVKKKVSPRPPKVLGS